MKPAIFLVLLFGSLSLHAQQLMGYSGPFETGNAQYQYFENDQGQRMFQGKFSYTDTIVVPGRDSCKVNVTGSYQNNKKNLAWAVTVKSTDLNETIIGQYSKGEKTGVWTHRLSNTNTQTDLKLVQASFFKNRFRGNFSYAFTPEETEGKYRSLTIKGKFDSQGKFDGDWVIDYLDKDSVAFQEQLSFQHGMLAMRSLRNIATTEVLEQEDHAEAVNSFFSNMNRMDSSSTVAGQRVGLKHAPVTHPVLKSVMQSWVELQNASIGNTYNATAPSAIIRQGEMPAIAALQARYEVIDWWQTPKGKAEKAEKERIQKAYDNKVSQADEQLKMKNYSNSIRLYKEALALKKEETYPKEKIKEAEELLAIQKKKESLNKSITAEVKTFKENDKKMKDEAFFKGKKHLFSASTILFDHLRKSMLSDHRETRTNLQRQDMEALTVGAMESYLKDVRTVTDMQKRVMKLVITEDTKDIEKELKKMDDPTQIMQRIKGESGQKL